jgi:hypothetical protein
MLNTRESGFSKYSYQDNTELILKTSYPNVQ